MVMKKIAWFKTMVKKFKDNKMIEPVFVPYLGFQMRQEKYGDVPLLCGLVASNNPNEWEARWNAHNFAEPVSYHLWLMFLLYCRVFHSRIPYMGMMVLDTKQKDVYIITDEMLARTFEKLAETGLTIKHLTQGGEILLNPEVRGKIGPEADPEVFHQECMKIWERKTMEAVSNPTQ